MTHILVSIQYFSTLSSIVGYSGTTVWQYSGLVTNSPSRKSARPVAQAVTGRVVATVTTVVAATPPGKAWASESPVLRMQATAVASAPTLATASHVTETRRMPGRTCEDTEKNSARTVGAIALAGTPFAG